MSREDALVLALVFSSRKMRIQGSDELSSAVNFLGIKTEEDFWTKIPERYLSRYDEISRQYRDSLEELTNQVLDENI